MIKIVSTSPSETVGLGKFLATNFKGGEILGLIGNLGGGKTTFVRGLTQGLKIKKKITSPTFIICNRYPIPNSKKIFYHIDLYRLHSPSELLELGFQEIIRDPRNIVAVEWPEKAKKLLPPRTVYIQFIHSKKPNQRVIKTWQKK